MEPGRNQLYKRQLYHEKRGKLLFKLVVEQDMIANITAAVNEVHLDDVERLRARCIREIRQTNGVINLEDAVRYQNGWDDQWSG